MTLAARSLVELDDSYARDLPELVLARTAAPALQPRLVELNEALARELGLDPAALATDDGVALLTGTAVPEGVTPVALVYSGHQFGNYSPRLGDGRALLLGELHDPEGHRRDLHLKGSGRTPFARGGDGKAALGPMLREYVISEAMHALGVPTTRSLAVTTTGESVMRDDGRKQGAVLARVAASHIRVGTFQYAAAQGGPEVVRRLADHAIARHHPAAAEAQNPYLALLEAVVAAQASLVARWMLVGFVHGVMNTDNVTISGETIDYGPCAFLDAFDPRAVYSSIDERGRYAYGNQPPVAQWNLARFAECLLPLIDDDQEKAVSTATAVLEDVTERYSAAWSAGMRAKLGLGEGDDDGLVGDLMTLLTENRVDYTSFFRALSSAARGDTEPARSLVTDLPAADAWLARWRERVVASADELDAVNPIYIPRNHKVEQALRAAERGDLAPFETLLDAVTRPFEERPGLEEYASGDPEGLPYTTYCGT